MGYQHVRTAVRVLLFYIYVPTKLNPGKYRSKVLSQKMLNLLKKYDPEDAVSVFFVVYCPYALCHSQDILPFTSKICNSRYLVSSPIMN